MPRRIAWRDTALNVNETDADLVLDGLKAFDIAKSNTIACTVCCNSYHKMRYRLLECSCEACAEAGEAITAKCSWRGKVVTCCETQVACIYEFGEHLTNAESTKRKKLTLTQKKFCRELADQHLRPMRIRIALSRKFGTSLDDMPSLSTVQNFVNHYARAYLENHDRLKELTAWIHSHAFNGSEQMTQSFAFGWNYDNERRLVVGNGSDEKPFIIGLTTKALLLRMMLPPDSFVLHVDATYKTNHVDYPVVVVGVSDRSRRFHLVALFIVSQETQNVYEAALMSLRRLYLWVTGKELVVQYAMADGDKAQRNALYSTFGFNPRFQFLMCFFHVMEKIQTAVKSIPSLLSASVLEDVYDLHFVRGHDAFLRLRDTIMKKWEDDPRLYLFSQYMNAQWLQGPFSTWQAYATPCGFATTNNPAETFNALLKRDYTLRRRLKMGTLLREFSSCCQDQSTTARAFAFGVIPSDSLTRRVSELVRARLLSTADAAAGECDGAGRPDIIYVKAMLAPRVIVAPNKRSEQGIAVSAQMGANYARMEVLGQPAGGWPVNIERQWCPCHYCFVFGTCVHVLYALRVTEYLDSCGRAILVSRKKRKRTALTAPDTGGRPRSAGPALSFV